jgi:acyl-CoA synthetase (NDP forming)
VLRAYGIRTSRDVLVSSAGHAAKAAAEVGYPVVLKVVSPDLLHKSDHGLVEVGLGSAAEVRRAYAELLKRAHKADRHADIEGVLVSELVTGGVECVVGMSTDDLPGPRSCSAWAGVRRDLRGRHCLRRPSTGRGRAHGPRGRGTCSRAPGAGSLSTPTPSST